MSARIKAETVNGERHLVARSEKKCDCGCGCEPVKGLDATNQLEDKRMIPQRIETLSILQNELGKRIEELSYRLAPISNNYPTPCGPAKDECPASTVPMVELLDSLISRKEFSLERIAEIISRLEI